MADTKQRAPKKPQVTTATRQHDAYQHDLSPYPLAGQNLGAAGAHPEKGARTLYDIKDLHDRFSDWSDSDLKQVPVLPEGSRLEQNATYIDLAAPQPREFTATGNTAAGPDHGYVPKSDVPYEIWNRLLGIKSVARTHVAE